MSVSVKQFEDGFSVHVWRNIEPGDVQNGRGQVDVQDNVRVAEKSQRCYKRIKLELGALRQTERKVRVYNTETNQQFLFHCLLLMRKRYRMGFLINFGL